MNKIIAYLLILPGFILMITFFIYPFISTIPLSLFKSDFLNVKYVGVNNYIKLLSDTTFQTSLINTIFYISIIVTILTVSALFMALFLYDMSARIQQYMRLVSFIPVFTSGIIMSSVWKWIFHPTTGLANWILGLFGVEPVIWFGHKYTSIIAISFIQIIAFFGQYLLFYMAASTTVTVEQIDAAKIDGCSWFQIKLKIILPQLKPYILLFVMLCTIAQIQIFEYIFMLCPFDYSSSIVYDIYKTGFLQSKYGYASAKTIILVFILSFIILAKNRIEKRIEI